MKSLVRSNHSDFLNVLIPRLNHFHFFFKKIIVFVDGNDCSIKHAVHYVGTLLDGTTFESTRQRDEPITIKLGQGPSLIICLFLLYSSFRLI